MVQTTLASVFRNRFRDQLKRSVNDGHPPRLVEVDPGTGQVAVRRFVAVDDCGVRINPTIVEGQIHGGLADGIGVALMELVSVPRSGHRRRW